MVTVSGPNGPIFRNKILASLPAGEIELLRPKLSRIKLVNGQVLHEAGERIEQVFFIEEGFASMVAKPDDEDQFVEVGVAGPEGMVGLPVMLSDAPVSFNRAMIQTAGFGYRMSSATFRADLAALPTLERLLLQALDIWIAQISQTAACNGTHALPRRLARWLLIAHDRTEGDELLLTQQFLSMMLAVRRSGVTVAINALETAGLVRSGRGRILVCDRPGLEAAACECYSRVEAFAAEVHARAA